MAATSLSAAQKIEQDLLGDLYRQHWNGLYSYVRRTFGMGPPEPDDVAQQAFMRFAAMEDPGSVQNPGAYLYRAAHNICMNERRRLLSRQAAEVVLMPSPEDESDDCTPERVLMAEEEVAVLRAAIRALPRERRRSFLWNRLRGLSCAEIARRTGYSESAVKKHVAQALDSLQASLTAAEQRDARLARLRKGQ